MSNWHALLVEDTADSAEVVEMVLAYHDISFTTARSAEAALDIVRNEQFDIVLVDLNLPGMSGWELLTYLRNNTSTARLPVVAMTAYHTNKVAEEAISAGFSAYFSKPIEATSFVHELRRMFA